MPSLAREQATRCIYCGRIGVAWFKIVAGQTVCQSSAACGRRQEQAQARADELAADPYYVSLPSHPDA